MLKDAKIIEIDDTWAGANRQRIVQRWVAEVLNAGEPMQPRHGAAAQRNAIR